MAKARISRFVKNSDFTTQKQRGRYIASINIPAGSYGYVTIIQQDFAVSGGAHMENAVIESSARPNEKYPTNYVVLDFSTYYIYLMIYQPASGSYRFRAVVVCPGGSETIPASTATVTLNLSQSPFVN